MRWLKTRNTIPLTFAAIVILAGGMFVSGTALVAAFRSRQFALSDMIQVMNERPPQHDTGEGLGALVHLTSLDLVTTHMTGTIRMGGYVSVPSFGDKTNGLSPTVSVPCEIKANVGARSLFSFIDDYTPPSSTISLPGTLFLSRTPGHVDVQTRPVLIDIPTLTSTASFPWDGIVVTLQIVNPTLTCSFFTNAVKLPVRRAGFSADVRTLGTGWQLTTFTEPASGPFPASELIGLKRSSLTMMYVGGSMVTMAFLTMITGWILLIRPSVPLFEASKVVSALILSFYALRQSVVPKTVVCLTSVDYFLFFLSGILALVLTLRFLSSALATIRKQRNADPKPPAAETAQKVENHSS
jgi:hypothetical protein